MSNQTLMQFNHDYADGMGTPEFIAALAAYLRNPNPTTVQELEMHGITVYGMAHHEDIHTRGFRSFEGKQRYRVFIKRIDPLND